MWGSKKKEQKKMPAFSEMAMVGHIERVEPKTWRGHKLAGKLPGNKIYDGVYGSEELETQVACDNGGGEYKCKVWESGNTANYIATHRFTIGGDPLVDGEPIEPIEGETLTPTKKRGGKEDPVTEVEKETELEKARMQHDKVYAERKKLREEQGLDAEPGFGEDESGSIELLREENKTLREDQAERERRRETERRDERNDRMMDELRQSRDQQAQLMQTVLTALTARPNDSGSDKAFEAQLKAMEAMISSSAASTEAILSSQDANRKESQGTVSKMMEMMTSRGDNMFQLVLGHIKETNESKLKAAETLAEAKSSNAADVLGLLKDTWRTAMEVGLGKDPDAEARPTSAIDLADKITERVSGVVTNYLALKGQQMPGLESTIRETAEAVAAETVGGGIAALPAPADSEEAETGGGLAGSPMPDQMSESGITETIKRAATKKTEMETARRGGVTRRARDGMNAVLKEFVKVVDEGKDLKVWMNSMVNTLPSYVQVELREAQNGTTQDFFAVLQKYGSRELVEKALMKLGEYQERLMAAKSAEGGAGTAVKRPSTKAPTARPPTAKAPTARPPTAKAPTANAPTANPTAAKAPIVKPPAVGKEAPNPVDNKQVGSGPRPVESESQKDGTPVAPSEG